MSYKFFYTDYCEGKEIKSNEAWDVELHDILHSMDCVLHMPENFLGIINSQQQTLQFMVNHDKSILIDIPITRNGQYEGSQQKQATLEECLDLVSALTPETNFLRLLSPEKTKPWWKIW